MEKQKLQPEQRAIYYTKISTKDFVWLSIGSIGIYGLVWQYYAWLALNKELDLKISPMLRAVLWPIFIWSLAQNTQKLAGGHNIESSYRPEIVAIGYIASFVLLGMISNGLGLVGIFLGALFLTPAATALQKYQVITHPEIRGLVPPKFVIFLAKTVSWFIIIGLILTIALMLTGNKEW